MFSSLKSFFVFTGLIALAASQSCAYKDQLSENPDDIGFYLYPKQGQEQRIELNNQSLENSAFNRDAEKTVILIAGFLDNRTFNLPAVVAPAYVASNRNYNIIVADWGLLSGSCCWPFSNYANMFDIYTKVVTKSIPIVANRTAEFIRFLNVDASKVHVVGHSLGAHVSGQVGKITQSEYNYTLSRITGLDPAGPLFTPPIPSRNLGKDDAKFVDVIHTNVGASGDTSIDGHVDFYPNGGFVQPGCADLPSIVAGVPKGSTVGQVVDASACSHQYATKLYAATLKRQFPACKCIDLAGDVLTGNDLKVCLDKCPSQAVLLGVDCPTSARGLYSLKTKSNP